MKPDAFCNAHSPIQRSMNFLHSPHAVHPQHRKLAPPTACKIALFAMLSAWPTLAAQAPERPAGTSELSGAQAASVAAAANTAEQQIAVLPPGPMQKMCKAGIANFKKMLNAEPSRVVNANGREGTTGTAAHTEPESQQKNAAGETKSQSSSGVGVGGEFICLGDKVPTQAPHQMGATLVHEGIRTKQTGEKTKPPPGQLPPPFGNWVPPLEERSREWHNDWQVFAAEAEYYSACAAMAAATGGSAAVILWFQGKSEERTKTAAQAAKNIGQALQGKIK